MGAARIITDRFYLGLIRHLASKFQADEREFSLRKHIFLLDAVK